MTNTTQPSDYGPIFATTIAKANVVLDHCASVGAQVVRVYGYNVTKDHNNKLCVDFMHYGDEKIRDAVVNYILANFKTLGVAGMISDRRVMGLVMDGSYRGPVAGWRPYSGPNPHTDHVHIQFTTKAMSPATPTTTAKPKAKRPNFVNAVNALASAHELLEAAVKGNPANSEPASDASFAMNDITSAITKIEKWAK